MAKHFFCKPRLNVRHAVGLLRLLDAAGVIVIVTVSLQWLVFVGHLIWMGEKWVWRFWVQ